MHAGAGARAPTHGHAHKARLEVRLHDRCTCTALRAGRCRQGQVQAVQATSSAGNTAGRVQVHLAPLASTQVHREGQAGTRGALAIACRAAAERRRRTVTVIGRTP